MHGNDDTRGNRQDRGYRGREFVTNYLVGRNLGFVIIPKTEEDLPLGIGTIEFTETVTLPGTMDENGKGFPNTRKDERKRLSLEQTFEGIALYRRTIEIPPSWQGQRITLLFERTRKTRVWLDGADIGENTHCTTSHLYELGTALTPGKHSLVVAVDNRAEGWPPGKSHMTSEDTQTNWNGILGKIQLAATPPVWISMARVRVDHARKTATFTVSLGNTTGSPQPVTLEVSAVGVNTTQPVRIPQQTRALTCASNGSATEVALDLGPSSPGSVL